MNVGAYSVSASFTSSDPKYTDATGSTSIHIGQAGLTITPDGGKTKLFGQTFSGFTGTVLGLKGSDAVSVTYASAGAPASAAPGSYDITVASYTFSTGSASNYRISTPPAVNGLTVRQNQTITFDTPAPTTADYNSTFPVAAHSDSGLAVTLAISSGSSPVCSMGTPARSKGVTTATVTMLSGTGTCVVNANQAGNATYLPAADQTSAQAAKINQSNFTVTAGSPLSYKATELVMASGGSGSGAVSYTLTLGPCSLSGGQLTAGLGVSSCEVTATKLGGNNYNLAKAVVSVSLQKAAQTITFLRPASPAAFGSMFNVAATSTSALPVSIGASGGCSISSGTVTMTSATTACTLTASQAVTAITWRRRT